MVPEVPSEFDDEALAGRAPQRASQSPRGAQPGDAIASLASGQSSETSRNREEGKEGARGTLGPDGSPAQKNLAAQQLRSQSTASVAQDDAISFDPRVLDGESVSSISLSPKTTTGSEDWLSVNFHVNFAGFDALAKQLDYAQECATKDLKVGDEVQFGDVRFLVSARGARQGRGDKSIFMRWRLTAENGLVLLLMNRGEAHKTMPNVSVRATSLLLMRLGFNRVWSLMQYCIEAMGGEIVGNKVSRVDPCVDLPGTDISEFVEPFNQRWVVSRSRKHAKYAIGTFVNEYLESKRHTGISIGTAPLMCRIYEKLVESQRDIQKRAVLEATRWGGLPTCACRVEFEILRPKLKQLGIGTVEDWINKRGDVWDWLTSDWLRLTDGPVDRKHANRTPIHPVWEKTRQAGFAWCGEATGQELRPLPKLHVDSSRQVNMVLGIFKGMFARVGKEIEDNYQFFREVEFAIRDAVGDRDMAAEIARKSLELGTNGIQ